jgi:hypothetical protein
MPAQYAPTPSITAISPISAYYTADESSEEEGNDGVNSTLLSFLSSRASGDPGAQENKSPDSQQ